MKNKDYWKKRFEQLEESSNKKANEVINELQPIYEQAEKEIDEKIAVWYQRFANNNEISIDEAKRLLNTKELEELKWDVNTYIKYGRENAINQQWMKELENASAKFHINRLEALKLQTRQSIEKLYNNQESILNNLFKDVYEDNYYKSIYEVQKGLNIGFDVTKIDNNTLEKIISKPWSTDGKNFSDRIWGSKSQLINELHNELTRACLLGKKPQELVDSISKKFNVSKSQASRLVYTEQAYFSSLSQKDSYKELGVEEFEVVGTLDGKTCSVCGDMDGLKFKMSDYEPGVTSNPFHPNCRCTTVPAIDEEYEEDSVRAARDKNGKTTYVPSNLKYNDWKEKYIKGNVNKNILKIAANSINKVFNEYKKNNSENLAIIDSKGNLLSNINTSKSDFSVSYSQEQMEIMKKYNRELIAIHNHPHNHTFSLQDIKETFINKALNGIIVTTQDYNYYFFPKLSDMNMNEKQIKYFMNWLEEEMSKTNDKMLEKYPNLSNNELNHLSYEEIFKKLEWEYGRERKK